MELEKTLKAVIKTARKISKSEQASKLAQNLQGLLNFAQAKQIN